MRCKGKMYLGLKRNGLMVSDAGFQDFFSAPYAGVEMSAAGLRLRCFLPLFARVMDMCSVFLRRLHQVLFWFGEDRFFMMFFVVWVSAICFWFDSCGFVF